jgi:hypothetical protein
MPGVSHIVVEGPPGSGKTTFLERLLESNRTKLIAVTRIRTDEDVDAPVRVKKEDEEARRLRIAGAEDVVVLRAPPDGGFDAVGFLERNDPFKTFADAFVHEVDEELPVQPELTVFVTAPPRPGEALLAKLPEAVRISASALSELLAFDLDPEFSAKLREAMEEDGELLLDGPERWTLPESHAGLARAGLVLVNVRGEEDREAAARTVAEIDRIRRDPEIARHVRTGSGHAATRITVRVADLSDPKDEELRRAIATVKRKMRPPEGFLFL